MKILQDKVAIVTGRMGGPVLWLSSPKASFVTGTYYPVYGGYLAQ